MSPLYHAVFIEHFAYLVVHGVIDGGKRLGHSAG